MLRTEIAGGIATVTIDQPGRSVNVLHLTFSSALQEEVARLAAMASVTGIVLTSAKEAFVVGADLAEVTGLMQQGHEKAAGELAALGRRIRLMESCGKPIVAALTGTALGGGLELALGCHYRIAADSPKAAYGFPEVGLGLLPAAGGTQRLPRLIGVERALPLLIEGHLINAAEAVEMGLIDEIVPPVELIEVARRVLEAGRVPARQTWDAGDFVPPHLPAAVEEADPYRPARAAVLACVAEGLRLPMDEALQVEAKQFRRLLQTGSADRLIAARFFLRQRMAKRGLRKADPADPVQADIAARLTAAIAAEAAHMRDEGIEAGLIGSAALRAGLPPPFEADTAAPAAPDGITGRLLAAGAEALAADADRDLADFVAIDLGLYPEWTGGPSRWRGT